MTRYFVGLDCGGSKTRGVLADESMRILARASAGPGNPLSAGMQTARKSYARVIRSLLNRSKLGAGEITAIVLGAAGAGRRAESLRISGAIRKLLPRALIDVETDGIIALMGGTLGKPGLIIIAGTGSFVLGVDSRGERCRGGGWGPLLGDEGSGAAVGKEAIQAVLRAEDGREPPTRLRTVVLSHFRSRTIEDLISRVYRKPPLPREYARLWPAVRELASRGDPAAHSILRRGGEDVARTAIAVLKRLHFDGPSIPVILAGGVLSQRSLLRTALVERLGREHPRARVVRAKAPPEIGALFLAKQAFKSGGSPRRG